MAKMYLMCGLSGAGKTTFAKKFAEENNLVYLSIDEVYSTYGKVAWGRKDNCSIYDDRDMSFQVWIQFFKHIHNLELDSRDILIDTNAPTFVKRQQFIDWFPNFDEHNLIYIEINDEFLRFMNNESRDRIVPRKEMERMRYEFEPPARVWANDPNEFLWKEKRWDKVIMYENIDNHFIRRGEKCENNDHLI